MKENPFVNEKEMDRIHHQLQMQIAIISVEEEEARMREEHHKEEAGN